MPPARGRILFRCCCGRRTARRQTQSAGKSRRWKSTTANYFDSLFSLTGKTALVTGGATGIGRMIAEALVRAGAQVIVASRKQDACEECAAWLNGLKLAGSAAAVGADLSGEAGITALTEAIAKRFPRLSI